MNIKILLAKYLDWIVLAALGLLFLYAAYTSFIAEDKRNVELSEEITRYDRTVREGMKKTTAEPIPKRDVVAELRNRFEHMPVMSPYRRNPFVPPVPIRYPQLIQLPKGKTKEIKLAGTRLTDIVGADPRVDVKLSYKPEERESVVLFTAMDKGAATISIRDDLEQTYQFELVLLETKRTFPPNPPADVTVVTRPPMEKGKERLQTLDLISFLPSQPSERERDRIGYTTQADVYRKPADAPNSEYLKLNKTPLLPVTSRDQIQQIWKQFQIEEEAPTEGAAPRTVTPAPGPVVPREAGEVTRPVKTQEAERAQTGRPPVGSFVFLDDTVEEGESYVYKIVTISTAEDAEPSSCENPYVTPTPVSVPSLVQFAVKTVSTGRAQIICTRRDPETGQPVSLTFTVIPGMKIGGKVRQRLTEGVDMRAGPRYKDIDFSTNCTLVDTLTGYRAIDYRGLRFDRNTQKWTYKVHTTPDPRIVYLTPRGFLRLKGKEVEERKETGAGPVGEPGLRPGMEPGIRPPR